MRYLLTNFTSATNPALTPTPFDSVTEEDGTVDVAYGAAVGYLGGAGMKINWSGALTGAIGYGRLLFQNKSSRGMVGGVVPLLDKGIRQNHVRVKFAFRFPTATGFGTNLQRIKLLRFNQNVNGTQTEVASVSWVKRTGGSGTKFQLRADNALDATSANSSDKDLGSYNTWLFLCVDLITVNGVAFINVGEAWPYTNSTQLAAGTVAPNSSTQGFTRLAFSTDVPVITSIDIGAISSLTDAGAAIDPSANSEMNISDLWVGDDVYPTVPMNGVCGNYEIDNCAVRLNYSYFADIGAITPALGGYETFPTVQMAIVPGGTYRVSATFAQNPPGEPITGDIGSGYTSVQAYEHSSEAFTFVSPEYTCRFPIGGQTQYILRTLPTQNALRLYSGEWTNAEFFIQRMR